MKIDGGLRQLFRDRLPFMHWQTVEMAYGITGVPDSNYCYHGKEGWIEFKRTAGWTAQFAPEQIGWAERRASEGGRVTIAVRRKAEAGPRKEKCDELWLFDGADAGLVATKGLRSKQPLLITSGSPAKWEWGWVFDILMRGVRYEARPKDLVINPHARLKLRRGSAQCSAPD